MKRAMKFWFIAHDDGRYFVGKALNDAIAIDKGLDKFEETDINKVWVEEMSDESNEFTSSRKGN